MRKFASIFVLMSISSSAFALSPQAISEALKVSKIGNISSISENTEMPTPSCPCELIKIEGTDASGKSVVQTISVEHRGDDKVKAVGTTEAGG
jgi:hypothetical protein